jgi:phosphatidylethanolamine-binding protein (PEBP) family uncharacterized protein
MNTFGTRSYLPPCPIPPGTVHHYTLELFATDRRLKFRSPPKDAGIRTAVKGHTLATARLMGTYALA